MSSASCLCEKVSWKIEGKPAAAYHCHCTMCRKHHGAAFGTYYLLAPDQFEWTGEESSIRTYRSSEHLERAFCDDCGSVVPALDDDTWYVPAGPHADGPDVNAHIFTGSKAAWYTIGDGLPQHETFENDSDGTVCATPDVKSENTGNIRGSCLCGAVAFEVVEPFRAVYHCHCSRCRKARSAAFTSNGFTSENGLRFIRGEDDVRQYKPPYAKTFTHAFCKHCGSGVGRINHENNYAVVPLGSLDDEPKEKPMQHIFVDDKAQWFHIGDDLPQSSQAPD